MRLALAFAALLGPATAGAATEVDLELVLAVDVSRSMSPAELDIQRRGYAEALTSPEVLAAIADGFLGRIAIAYMEWGSAGATRVVVGWTVIADRADAEGVAAALLAHAPAGLGRTSISGAIGSATALFEENGFTSARRVIDISGDGPNNEGPPVTEARDAAVAAGFVINGLPLMTRDGDAGMWHIDELDAYYAACVTGGPGAFVIPVRDWRDFPAALRGKLVLEIAGRRPPAPAPRLVPAQGEPPFDCLIGERIWDRNRGQRNWQ